MKKSKPSTDRAVKEHNKNYVYLDVMRVVAILAVLAIHTDAGSLYLKMPLGSISYTVCMFISMFISFSPVIFFMISGALLLGKKETVGELWKKRILKMVIVLILVSLMYLLFDMLYDMEKAAPAKFFASLYSEPRIAPLWYLYAYLAFLITLPFLRGIASVIDEKTGLYFFVLCIVLRYVIPSVEKLFGNVYHMEGDLRWDWIMNTVVVFPVLGYWLHEKADMRKIKRIILPLAVADIAALIYYTYLAYQKNVAQGINAVSDSFRGKINLFHAVCIFVLIRVICDGKISENKKSISRILGESVFGIYLIHGVFLDRISIIGRLRDTFFGCFNGIALLIPSVIWIAAVFALSFVSVRIAKKIPFLNRLI